MVITPRMAEISAIPGVITKIGRSLETHQSARYLLHKFQTSAIFVAENTSNMHILLLGSGGREHALAWKISQSPRCRRLSIAPGNAGTAACGDNVALSLTDFSALRRFAVEQAVDMVVVGPEDPLVQGIWDDFRRDPATRHISVIGPSAEAAQLEGSKAFAKAFMQEFGIPTAAYRAFEAADLNEGLQYIAHHPTPVVLKADGLAAGKGVLICTTTAEAQREFRDMLGGKFGTAGHKVVVEQFLDGIEFSVFALTDGQHYRLLPVAKDYKRIGEGDTGLNTGGMGAVSPPPFITPALMQKVVRRIVEPTLQGIRQRHMSYCGFIFFGLILVDGDPWVIEYNCRMGDPETEVVIPRLRNDIVPLFQRAAAGTLHQTRILTDRRAAATVILASGGYPGDYEKGKRISGIDQCAGSLLFQAGTRQSEDGIFTNGGRVIAVTALAENLAQALSLSRSNAAIIQFDGKYYRRDIGFDL